MQAVVLRKWSAALLLGALALAGATAGAAGLDAASLAALAKVVDGPQRSAANKARDVYRHPLETLAFFGLRPDQAVIEIAPGGGWYTEILAPYLHDQGRLYAAQRNITADPEEQAHMTAALDKKLASDPALYGKVVVGSLPVQHFTDIDPPGGADMVLTFRNIHNWAKDGHLDQTLRAFYDVLKPGGVLGVEEHRAKPGTSFEQMIATGYLTEDYVIEHARAVGFVLAGKSEINANPRDDANHPDGVWSLPPTLRGGDKDKDTFLAIGESDRMTLRFVKP